MNDTEAEVKTVLFPSEPDPIAVAFEPAAYNTAEAAAKAFYEVLCNLAREMDYDPDIEIWIKNPREAKAHGYGVKDWWVCWESGPYEWGIYASGAVAHSAAGWWTEPQWGFDLIFHQEART